MHDSKNRLYHKCDINMIDMTYLIVFIDEKFNEKDGNLSIFSLHETIHDDYDCLLSILLLYIFLEILKLYLEIRNHRF